MKTTQAQRGPLLKGPSPAPANPTATQYSGFSAAYAHFNRELFENSLPNCLITLQRRKGAYGYYSPERFKSSEGNQTDEIAMNPRHFKRPANEVLSTLIHEMVHLWQQHYGKPPAGNYHNKEWAAKMKTVGLYPSTTGKPGGKETSQNVSHYIIERGVFEKACTMFLADGFILYNDDSSEAGKAKAKKKAASKTKYTCSECDTNAWAKPNTHLNCGACDVMMTASDSED